MCICPICCSLITSHDCNSNLISYALFESLFFVVVGGGWGGGGGGSEKRLPCYIGNNSEGISAIIIKNPLFLILLQDDKKIKNTRFILKTCLINKLIILL